MAAEIDRTQATIEKVIGFRPNIFRPPYGARWFGLVPTLLERGMHLVLWSAAGYDWKKDVQGITEATLRELKPGAVILLHDGRETRSAAEIDRSRTVLALPGIIAGARQRGTLSPLLRISALHLTCLTCGILHTGCGFLCFDNAD